MALLAHTKKNSRCLKRWLNQKPALSAPEMQKTALIKYLLASLIRALLLFFRVFLATTNCVLLHCIGML